MKHRMIVAALGCGLCMLLNPVSPLFFIPALGCLIWLAAQALKAAKVSETDPLTGLGNLRHLENHRHRYEKAARLTVGYFDIDRLKQTNDTRGHTTGDALLKTAAQCLSGLSGHVYRIGGDEFLLLSEGTATASLARQWDAEAGKHGIHVSCGWAEGSGAELDSLIQQAEQNMYGDKNGE